MFNATIPFPKDEFEKKGYTEICSAVFFLFVSIKLFQKIFKVIKLKSVKILAFQTY